MTAVLEKESPAPVPTEHPPIVLKVSRYNGPQWAGEVDPHRLPLTAERLAALGAAYCAHFFPGVPVEAVVTEEYVDGVVYGTPPEIIQRLAYFLFPLRTHARLLADDFDPETFLAEVL